MKMISYFMTALSMISRFSCIHLTLPPLEFVLSNGSLGVDFILLAVFNRLDGPFSDWFWWPIFVNMEKCRIQKWLLGFGSQKLFPIFLHMVPIGPLRNNFPGDIAFSLVLHYVLIIVAKIGLVEVIF